jgi:hypothetical protein
MTCGHCGRTDLYPRYNYKFRVKLLFCIHCGWEENPPPDTPKYIPYERPNRTKLGNIWIVKCSICGEYFETKWGVRNKCYKQDKEHGYKESVSRIRFPKEVA